jgi:hypothetical protein
MRTNNRRPIVATDFRLDGRQERFVGASGEINAGSQKELLRNIGQALQVMAGGQQIVTEASVRDASIRARQNRELVEAAFQDNDRYLELGQVLAEQLYVSANKQGFARQFMRRQELSQGQIPSARMEMKNVVAITASSPTRVETQPVRDNWFYPPEFYISTRAFIEQRDIDRSNTDILEQKYLESMEGIMVAEDKVWLNLANQSVGISNVATSIAGTLTPLALARVRSNVTRWRIPAASMLMASDLWADIVGNQEFAVTIDPVTKHELFLEGELGTILGMKIYTDAYRHQTHHVLNAGEFWIIGEATQHGQYTDRGGVNSEPISGAQEKVPGRGWWMTESMSFVLANSRSVAKAVRV